QSMAIPLASVRRTLRIKTLEITRTDRGETVVLDGKLVSFAPLARLTRFSNAFQVPNGTWSAVLIESNGSLATVGVDRLVGTQTVLLRPLPDFTPPDPMISGASLDSEGNPQIVLDPDGLVVMALRNSITNGAAPERRRQVLVIDDSLTTRM